MSPGMSGGLERCGPHGGHATQKDPGRFSQKGATEAQSRRRVDYVGGVEMPEQPTPGPQTREFGRRTVVIADVEPLDVDGVRTVAVGTVLWLVAFVLLLPFYGRLQETDRVWWLWTCVAGFGLGVIGWDHCRRRRNRRRAQADAGTGRAPR